MTLADHVDEELQRLRARLRREGIADVRSLEYSQYLRTSLWRKIKQWIFDRDLHKCVVCKRQKLSRSTDDMDVHHRSYEIDVLEGRREDMLVSLCTRCHRTVEFYKDGSKRTSMLEKDAEYLRIKALHNQIEQTGLAIRITEVTKGKARTLDVSYIGDAAFQEFYGIDSVMMSFIHHFRIKHGEFVSLPMPFSHDKLKLKSGAKVWYKASKRTLIAVNSDRCMARIRIAAGCPYLIRELLVEAVASSKYWRTVDGSAHSRQTPTMRSKPV